MGLLTMFLYVLSNLPASDSRLWLGSVLVLGSFIYALLWTILIGTVRYLVERGEGRAID